MTLRVCNVNGCPELCDGGRCTQHRRAHDRARGKTYERGYNKRHVKLRSQWQRRLDSGEHVTCWRCGTRIDPTSWHLGHDDDDRTVYRGPECVPCNTATASRRH